jgi:hypothetical protein
MAHNNSCTILASDNNGLSGPVIDNNALFGPILTEITFLYDNGLDGPIPTEIGLLKDLVFLDFRELLPWTAKSYRLSFHWFPHN